jgi:hypothetical protein
VRDQRGAARHNTRLVHGAGLCVSRHTAQRQRSAWAASPRREGATHVTMEIHSIAYQRSSHLCTVLHASVLSRNCTLTCAHALGIRIRRARGSARSLVRSYLDALRAHCSPVSRAPSATAARDSTSRRRERRRPTTASHSTCTRIERTDEPTSERMCRAPRRVRVHTEADARSLHSTVCSSVCTVLGCAVGRPLCVRACARQSVGWGALVRSVRRRRAPRPRHRQTNHR